MFPKIYIITLRTRFIFFTVKALSEASSGVKIWKKSLAALSLVFIGIIIVSAVYFYVQASLAGMPEAENLEIKGVKINWKDSRLTGVEVANKGSKPSGIVKVVLLDAEARLAVYSQGFSPPVMLNAGEVKMVNLSHKLLAHPRDYEIIVITADGAIKTYDFSYPKLEEAA